MDLCFVFPALQCFGYESGFSINNPAWQSTQTLEVEISRFRAGVVLMSKRFTVTPAQMNVRLWESDWGVDGASNWSAAAAVPEVLDLYSLRVLVAATDRDAEGMARLEGQMLYRNAQGWSSSLLSNFVPLRPPGYKFSPIIHTGHYFADPRYANYTLLLNRCPPRESASDAGIMSVRVQRRDGSEVGVVRRSLTANAVDVMALDDMLRDCGADPRAPAPDGGYNLTFTGGASQFAIFTMFQDRNNGSIGMEHSLAPLYYIPQLRNPTVRARVYAWVGK